jgi:hypothetical protein
VRWLCIFIIGRDLESRSRLTSLMVAILFLGGCSCSLGVLGEYVGRI